ncbi:MAG: hypothetical protein ACJAVJ_001491 [Planctomycetota bacterium]
MIWGETGVFGPGSDFWRARNEWGGGGGGFLEARPPPKKTVFFIRPCAPDSIPCVGVLLLGSGLFRSSFFGFSFLGRSLGQGSGYGLGLQEGEAFGVFDRAFDRH